MTIPLWCAVIATASTRCSSETPTRQVPQNLALCALLEADVRQPSAFSLDRYERKLAKYVGNYCHRRPNVGWKVDKRIRDTGPYIATLQDGKWIGKPYGTHPAVLIWYSPEMYTWLKANRPGEGGSTAAASPPVPDGAIIIKEMFDPPAVACADVDWQYLKPSKSVTLMVRDSRASHDGWFWGWFDWTDWNVDWPADEENTPLRMGFGQYCVNCHASAKDNQTFASLRNIKGEPGEPLTFLSQDFFLDPSWKSHHGAVALAGESLARATAGYDPAFASTFAFLGKSNGEPPPTHGVIVKMTSEIYDNVWVPAGGPSVSRQFVTSNQCVGCHDAGSTGLQYDMTEPRSDGKLRNISQYATWRGSPMGLSGRDPIVYAQLASETETFHPGSSAAIADICLGCHAVAGQRQFAIDRFAQSGQCEKFARAHVDSSPHPAGNPASQLARYAALARDGVTCAVCHQMVLGSSDSAQHESEPQNKCVAARQAFLNPHTSGVAKTFSGSFLLGSADVLVGPFADPKRKSMKNALGISPEPYKHIRSSELCGSCHVVHLPILSGDRVVGHAFEQTTYAEWAFSDYRTGTAPDGELPLGAGARAQSCQDCHMPNRGSDGQPYRSKIASIQEYSNFPQAEYTLPAEDIDLPKRSGFAQHALVGLNIFLTKMAQQFPRLLGIHTEDPMLTAEPKPETKGIDPLWYSEEAILDQAKNRTAEVSVTDLKMEAGTLSANVTVVNKSGHKFPTGVGLRRAFIEFSVLDDAERILWSSGRTNGAGAIVDAQGAAIPGELWWKPDCSGRANLDARAHQPHYQVIDRQDQAQIYEELVSAPADIAAPKCGIGAEPAGALTTSFLSQCARVKDNRILPHGFLPLEHRAAIATSLGAGDGLAEETGPSAVGNDPDYRSGGADTLSYRVPLSELGGKPASVRATLYYQATPPYYLQDRFCTSRSADTRRLYFMAGNLNLKGTPARDWKLKVATSGAVALP
jgi:hypothetical protein